MFKFANIKEIALFSAALLIATGFVTIDTAAPNAQAAVSPVVEDSLGNKNTIDYFATLNGTSQYFSSTNSAQVIPASATFSAEAWINEADGESGRVAIITQGVYGGESNGVSNSAFVLELVGAASMRQIQIFFRGDINSTYFTGVLIPQDRWSHVAVTDDGISVRLFVDGKLAHTKPRGELGSGSFSSGFSIGKYAASQFKFNGAIDQVKIWDVALTESAVAQSMHSWSSSGVIGVDPSALRALYDFNDRSTANGKLFNKAKNDFHLDIKGSPTYTDIKNVEEFNGQVIYSFPRTYLNEVGGFVVPETTQKINAALVVGGGAAGREVAGGGGGGGASQYGWPTNDLKPKILGIIVGQGGTNAGNANWYGQKSAIFDTNARTSIVDALGGAYGGSWPGSSGPANWTGGVGGVASTSPGFIGKNGAVGGNGPMTTSANSTGSPGVAGATVSNILTGNLSAPIRFGGGGGGGASSVDSSAVAISSSAGGAGGGGQGASVGENSAGQTLYVSGSSIVTGNTLGGSIGGHGAPNTGGGGGGGLAYGAQFKANPNTKFDGERTYGGNGGSGVVVLSVLDVAKCVFASRGYTVPQKPRVSIFPLTGVAGQERQITAQSTTQAAFDGNGVLMNKKLYYVDRGSSKLRRMNTDGSELEVVANLVNIANSGLATDGANLYGYDKRGVFSYNPSSGVFTGGLITAPSGIRKEGGGIAYWFNAAENKGYLFITNETEKVLKVPLDATSINLVTHLFSESRLGAEGPIPGYGVTVMGDKVYWGGLSGPIFAKDASKSEQTSAGADAKLTTDARSAWSLASYGERIYYNKSTAMKSVSTSPGAVERLERVNTGSTALLGFLILSRCGEVAPQQVEATLPAGVKTAKADWSAITGAGSALRPQALQYRTNGGTWTQSDLVSGTATSQTLTEIGTPGDLLEFRVSIKEFGIWSNWHYSEPVILAGVVAPALVCEKPMKLKYSIARAGDGVQIKFGQTQGPIQIAWGDGQVEPTVTGNFTATHNYAATGEYVAEICGNFGTFENRNQRSLRAVLDWGDSAMGRTGSFSGLVSLEDTFNGAFFLTDVPAVLPPSVSSLVGTFRSAANFNDPDISQWSTSGVTKTDFMFKGANRFNQPLATSGVVWDMSKVTSMNHMFGEANLFNQPLNSWNTGEVTAMNWMFFAAYKFNQPLSSWDTRKLEESTLMFHSATDFNQSVSAWVTPKLAYVSRMFQNASSFNNGGFPLTTSGTAWNMSNARNMSDMFSSAVSFNQPVSNWDTGKVTSTQGMFSNASSFNQDISSWSMSNVLNTSDMFNKATAFAKDVSGWDTAKVANASGMFKQATGYTHSPPLKINVLKFASNMLDFSGISDDTYGATLQAWSNSARLTGVTLGAVDKTAPCVSRTARDTLSSSGWVITDKTDPSVNCTPEIVVTAKNTSQVYGDPVPSVGFSITTSNNVAISTSDWIKDISCKAVVSGSATVVTSFSSVSGAKATVCSGPSGTGLGLKITYVNGTHEITQRPLTLTVKNRIKLLNSSLTFAPSTTNSAVTQDYVLGGRGLVGSDGLTVQLDSAGKSAGSASVSYSITVVVSGDQSANYGITTSSGVLNISSKSLAITAKSQVKTFGEPFSFSGSGWYCVDAGTCSDAITSASSVISLQSAGFEATAAAGSYVITTSITSPPTDSEVINTNGGLLTVLKKKLTVSPLVKSVQAGSKDAGNYAVLVSGFVGSDNAGMTGFVTPTCTSGYTPETPRGTALEITCTGGTPGANYEFVYESSTLTVPSASVLTNNTRAQYEPVVDPDSEDLFAVVPFSFDVSPVNQICFGNLLISTQDEAGERTDLEPIRQRLSGSKVAFEGVSLREGDYSYEFVADGNCYVEPITSQLTVGFFPTITPPPIAPTVQPEPVAGPTNPLPTNLKLSPSAIAPETLVSAVLRGNNLKDVVDISIGGKKVNIISVTNDAIALELPKLATGRYDILLTGSDGLVLRWLNSLLVGDVTADGSTTSSPVIERKVNAGVFKNFVAIYAKGYKGQQLTAKVAGRWLKVDSLSSNFVRVLRKTIYVIYPIKVEIHIDGKLEKKLNLITK